MKKKLILLCLLAVLSITLSAQAEDLQSAANAAALATTAPQAVQPVSFTPQPTAAPVSATPAANIARTVTIRRSGDVNVRREPRFDSAKVGVARAGRTYSLIEVAESGWYKIRLLDGVEGYISPKLVQGDPEASTAQRVIIRKSGNANVRQEPDASSHRVGVARAGRSYPLLATAENGWYRILLSGGIVGYVSPKVVSRVGAPGENPDATPTPVPENTVLIRRKGNVNVRQEPQFDSTKVGTATAGRRYPLVSTAENGWYKIRLENGIEGYISSKLAN